MARQASSPTHTAESAKAYNRILERTERALAEFEINTWEGVQEEINRAVALEAELAELTRDELDLLRAYVERDLKDLRGYVRETRGGLADWLGLDLKLVEYRIRDLLLSIADKTLVEQVELDQKLHHEPGDYLAGEVACAGMLRCLSCGHMACLVETAVIEPCHRCGEHYFQRVTARWPREPEVAEPSDHM